MYKLQLLRQGEITEEFTSDDYNLLYHQGLAHIKQNPRQHAAFITGENGSVTVIEYELPRRIRTTTFQPS